MTFRKYPLWGWLIFLLVAFVSISIILDAALSAGEGGSCSDMTGHEYDLCVEALGDRRP